MQSAAIKAAFVAAVSREACFVAAYENLHGHSDEWVSELEDNFSAQAEHLYVHIIPHSHDDVGWLKTIDEYFTGSNQDEQNANVENIIDTYVMELMADKEKRFTQVEMKFFSMWWQRQTEQKKYDVRQLVREGRLEFVNAGWSMQDEACTHHDDMMNNMMVGHEFLLREFGDFAIPRIGWHIDPFGHSNANPRLFAEMGFDAWFFARIDYEDKAVRMDSQSMQWVWKPFSESLGDQVSIFTHCMPDHYHQPEDFRYDERNFGTDPVVADKTLSDFNADEKMESLRSYILDDATHFKTNRLMIPWGDDFWYSNAHLTFVNLQTTIEYFNSKYDDITLLYSTPSEFVNALKEQEVEWPVRYDDMFPYADGDDDYWTGYFTSRADLKKQVRQTQANLHASNKLYAQKLLQKNVSDETVKQVLDLKHTMFDAMGIMQHHDAVTGTSTQHVADSYTGLMTDATTKNNSFYAKMMSERAAMAGLSKDLQWTACHLTSTSPVDCSYTAGSMNAGDTYMISAHNPATIKQELLRFEVSASMTYKVYGVGADQTWVEVPSDKLCYTATKDNQQADQFDACELFIRSEVAPQGTAFFKVEVVAAEDPNQARQAHQVLYRAIENDNMALEYVGQDENDRVMFKFTDQKNSVEQDLAFSLQNYTPSDGSGAYLFKPNLYVAKKQYSTFVKIETFKAAATGVNAFVVYFRDDTTNEMYTSIIRVTPGGTTLEWEVQMHGIPHDPSTERDGKEVVVNWELANFDNASTFYTDSNGLEMQKRVLDQRPDFPLVTDEVTSSNYYPINSALVIRNEETSMQLTVMNDRSQGGSVLTNGSVELMQNRRLHHDDQRGVGEALNETNANGVGIQVNTRYFLQLFNYGKDESVQRKVQLAVDEPVVLFVAPAQDGQDQLGQKCPAPAVTVPEFNGDLKIHLLPVDRLQVLIRLENLADLFDGAPAETPMFDLRKYALDLLAANNGDDMDVRITERTLSNNQDYAEMAKKKFQWPTESGPGSVSYPEDQEPNAVIALQPQRIRLFRVDFHPKGPAPPREFLQ